MEARIVHASAYRTIHHHRKEHRMKARLWGLALLVAATAAAGDQYVQGYMRADGTYVPGYYRSSPNNTKVDNYSTQGNINPYTAQPGYVNPYAQPLPQPYVYKPYQPAPPAQPQTYHPYQYQPYQPYQPNPR